MIYLVKVRAPAPATFNNVVHQLEQMSNGFFTLTAPGSVGPQEGVQLVVTDTDAAALRSWLRTIGATQVAVLQLQRRWSTWGDPVLTEWLQGAHDFF